MEFYKGYVLRRRAVFEGILYIIVYRVKKKFWASVQ
jgi:hypothetical protein